MIVDCAIYEAGTRLSHQPTLEDAYAAAHKPECFVWIGLHDPTIEEFDRVARNFQLHDLAVEDAIKAHQRPKLEDYGDSLFLVLKPARYLDRAEEVEFGEIHIFVGAEFLVTVRHGGASALHGVREELERHPDLLALGPRAAVHAIVDRVVDDYAPVVEGLDNDIQEVEEAVFSVGAANPAERIYKLKREVLEFHRATASLVEPLGRLASGQVPVLSGGHTEYFRDVHDHLLRVVDQVDGYRTLLTTILEANLTQVSVRQNEDMRKISAWVAIAAVPTAIAAIYGMNFEFMPEVEWRYGYPTTVAVMVVACTLLYRAFRRSGWL